ncbi:MAG TPA: PrsW family intramembrane metalloprotease, partial [Candidatus Binatia bacterium]|nr:PrsW family intramembrane metalloprotease [Candidatus Binatia bacterium]
MAVRAAYPHRFRPRRYVIATFLIGVVVVLVTASSLASALFSGATLQVFLFGLPSLALLIAGTAFGLRGLSEPGTIRRRGLLRAAVLLGLGLVFWALVAESSLVFHGVSPGTVLACALACVPTTGFALWVVRRMDRNEKEPWRVMLAAVIWGGVVATTLALWGNELWSLLITNNIPPGAGANQSLGLSAGIVEEISKGLAVLLLYLLVRNEFDGLVDGIVYGAVVGLGFNFMESLIYMSSAFVDVQAAGGPGAAGAAIQWGLRQVLGLFFGHATYTAMAGAGIGIAR